MNPLRIAASALFCTLTLVSQQAAAVEYVLPAANSRLIGENQEYVVPADNRPLEQIAADFQLGLTNIMEANPGVDPYLPTPGSKLVIPHQLILPNAPREGIVINVAEMRLYYYPKAGADGERVVYTYPVSIGRMDWKTPLGVTKVTSKEVDPPWRPPASIKAEHAAQGDILPDVVPGGPDNPLGRHALRLGIPSYLIHGTNRPNGIGMRVTHGCVRMYPEDIQRLFETVSVGAPVLIVDQPIKAGWSKSELYLSVNLPFEEDETPHTEATIERAIDVLVDASGGRADIDINLVIKTVEEGSGRPVVVGKIKSGLVE